MVVDFNEPEMARNDSFSVTVTSNSESTGEKESRSQDRTLFERADSYVERNDHWFAALSTMAIVGVEGYWLIRKVTG